MMFEHKSVLLGETIESLRIRPDGVYVDGTLGGGGHAFEVLKRLSDKGRLIGMDQDADAIAAASKRLSPFGGRAVIVRSNYEQMGGVLSDLGRRDLPGSGGFVVSARYAASRVFLPGGRPAGYAHGSARRKNGKGFGEYVQRRGVVPHDPGLR